VGAHGHSGSVAATTTASVVAPTEELHLFGDKLGDVALLAVLALVGAGLDPSLDVHQPPLAQVLRAGLRETPPRHHAEPLGLFAALTARGGVVAAGRDVEVRDRVAVGRVAH